MKSAELKERNYQFKTNINMKTKTSILAQTKAFFILLVMCCAFGCNSDNEIKGYTLNYGDGDGWKRRSCVVSCDSFKMITPKECIFWNKGVKGNIISNDIILVNNVRW